MLLFTMFRDFDLLFFVRRRPESLDYIKECQRMLPHYPLAPIQLE
ncbi:hypothetical protein [Candidatus Hakubella thermalkaliphila]|nr:hypothetical protein [Candidatus Hakubella thermalkaliphila]